MAHIVYNSCGSCRFASHPWTFETVVIILTEPCKSDFAEENKLIRRDVNYSMTSCELLFRLNVPGKQLRRLILVGNLLCNLLFKAEKMTGFTVHGNLWFCWNDPANSGRSPALSSGIVRVRRPSESQLLGGHRPWIPSRAPVLSVCHLRTWQHHRMSSLAFLLFHKVLYNLHQMLWNHCH